MSRGLLPEHIGPLVDRLRSGDHHAVSLPDVAALTEVLMRSLESYFKSVDLTIYEECQSLADYIDDARLEISSLSPNSHDHEEVGIPRAGLELAAIVQQTESATNTIMESAERIMEADPENMESYTETVNDAVMQIFEACSFQDITGQRISKVVNTLEHVEDRVAKLINILGVMENPVAGKDNAADDTDPDKALLNGPALEGEGIDQDEIDALLNGEADDSPDGDSPNIDIEAATPEEDLSEAASSDTAEVPEHVSTDDIDFMFDGQDNSSKDAPEAVTDHGTEEINNAADDTPPAEELTKVSPPTPETEPNLIAQAKQKKAAAQAAKKVNAAPPKPVVYDEDPKAGLSPKATENTTQEDIDALFS